jgi:hypothetical protein
MAQTNVSVPYRELSDIAGRAGVAAGMSRFEIEQRLLPFQDEVLAWAYRRMVDLCRQQGVVPVWVYLPQIGDRVPPERLARFTKMAVDAGFVTMSLEQAFAGRAPGEIWFGEWDHHPNATGHRLIGELLHTKILESRPVFQIRTTAMAPQ